MNKNIFEFAANLKVDPTIVRELGRNLYSTNNSIIVELIANSYDADAKEVYINYCPKEDFIEILDDGMGMDKRTIEEGFLKIGNLNFEKPPSKLKRNHLGRKGIGKLSFFALGNIIEVETIKNNVSYKFKINYNELMSNEEHVIKIKTIELDKTKSKTRIRITKLLDSVKTNDFFKQMVIGIYHVFYNLLSSNFKIFISNKS